MQQIREVERGSVKKRMWRLDWRLSAVDTCWDRRAAEKQSRTNAPSRDSDSQPGAAANNLRGVRRPCVLLLFSSRVHAIDIGTD
jgi:hypothetical protein